jgi:hypothetical protein
MSHQHYSQALRNKRRSGPREAQSRERVKFIKKKHPVYSSVSDV